MSSDQILTLLFITMLCAAAAWQYFGIYRRTQARVAADLFAADDVVPEETLDVAGDQFEFSGEGAALGLFRPSEKLAFMRRIALYPWAGALAFTAFRFVALPLNKPVSVTVSVALTGLAVGYIVGQAKKRAQGAEWERRCLFALPITMERLVMGVQAGLDLLAVLTVVLKDEEESPTNDPILELLGIVMKLTESGLPFEQALREVGARVPLSAVKHAFTHLAVAHREGGELVMPLKELSNATQAQYQETIEEEIARLPVKATLPLLCTFAGLIVFFVTSPLIQVITMTSSVAEKLK